MTYAVTLLNVNTVEPMTVDIEQESALDAQRVAEDLYQGYRVIRIVRAPSLWSNTIAIADGALGDF